MDTVKNKNQYFQLSQEGLAFVKKEMARYETKRSAILPCLYRVQKENGGWVPASAVSYLSRIMNLPESHINEVLMFYTLYNRRPPGRLHIRVCGNLSCAMNGAREILQHLCQQFRTKEGTTRADGSVSIHQVECIGACDMAPVAIVNDQYIGPLKKSTVVEQIQKVDSAANSVKKSQN